MDKKIVSKEERQIGARVRAVREMNHLTQEQMAEKMGMNSTPHYQNIENGRNSVGYKHLKCLKTEFGVSSDFILFGETQDAEEFVFEFESLPAEEKVDTLMKILSYLCEKNGVVHGKIINSKREDKNKRK